MSDEQSLEKVAVEFVDETGEPTVETVWAASVGDDLYEIRNSPWFAYRLNWGDVVRTQPADGPARVAEVVRRSGHRTLRVYFNRASMNRGRQDLVMVELNRQNAYVERASEGLVAVDVEPEADYDAVIRYLGRLQDNERLIFEEAWRGDQEGFGPVGEPQPTPAWLEPT